MKTLCCMAVESGMNEEEYNRLEIIIKETALDLLTEIKSLHKTDTGMFYDVNEIITDYNELEEQKKWTPYVVVELKQLGVEFRNIDGRYHYRF